MRKFLLIPVTLVLASCGTADAEPQTVPPPPVETFDAPEPVSLEEPQSFEYTTLDGAKGVLTIPAAPEPTMHEYLTLTGQADDKTYAKVDVDNREGYAEYGVYEVNLYTPEGDVVTFYNLNNSIGDLNIDVPDEHIDAYYELDHMDDVAVGQRADEYAITDQPIPEQVSRIEVTQVGGGSAEAYPGVPEGAIQ